ncbi:MAG: hypothetical protein ACI9HA_002587 [Dinoroseobacter sp.]
MVTAPLEVDNFQVIASFVVLTSVIALIESAAIGGASFFRFFAHGDTKNKLWGDLSARNKETMFRNCK